MESLLSIAMTAYEQISGRTYKPCKIVGPADGYGRPDRSLVETPAYTVGWNQDNNGWWYADSTSTYYTGWQFINHHWYYFNSDGYAVTGWHEIDGEWYYFEPTAGHPKECAMYVTKDKPAGAQAGCCSIRGWRGRTENWRELNKPPPVVRFVDIALGRK